MIAPVEPELPAAYAPDGAAAREKATPKAGEKTTEQVNGFVFFGSMTLPNGGEAGNPCGFQRYGSAYTGTYDNYRFILNHPTVQQVRGQVYAQVVSNAWGTEAREGTPENVKQFIVDTITPEMIMGYKREGFRAFDYGHAKFEKIWISKGGRWIVERLKPLRVENNHILIYPGGRFAGVRYGGGDQWLSRRESVLHTHDGEAGYVYGRSRLENIREYAWREWLDAATQMQLTCLKIANKLCVLTTPSGSYTDRDGKTIAWREVAVKVGQLIADPRSNGTIWIPTAAVPKIWTEEEVKLASIPLVTLDVKDFGNHAEAIMGFLQRMQAAQSNIFSGYHRSPRTGLESKNGSRADSEEHTDTDTTDVELLDAELCGTFNEQVVDDVLALNFGEEMRGAVKFVPAKLRDEHREIDHKLLDAAMNNPETAGSAIEAVDYNAVYERRNIPKEGGKKVKIRTTLQTPGDEKGPGEDPEEEGGDDGDETDDDKPKK